MTQSHSKPNGTQRYPSRSRCPRLRVGRALVECVVAALLLAVTTLALAASTRGTLALADDSQLIGHAQALATTRAESATGASCAANATANANGTDTRPRVTLLWQLTNASTTSQVHLDLSLDRSPIAFNNSTSMQFAIEAGGVCP